MKDKTILIIDDNPDSLGLIESSLANYEFEILVARDGESGIEKAAFTAPDLILLDVTMPGIDGFETCHRLKKSDLTTNIPVIFLTALSDPEEKVRAFEVGAVDFITKPIHKEEMVARVLTHLRLKVLNESLEQQVEKRTNELEKTNRKLLEEIAERKKIEKELEIIQANLLQAQHIAHLGSWEWDVKQNRSHGSEEFYRLFGLPSQSNGFSFENFIERVHPDDRKRVEQSIKNALAGQESYDQVYRIIRPDGAVRFHHSRAEVTFDKNDQPAKMLGIQHDITDRKNAEEAVKKSEERLKLALESVSDAVWDWRTDINEVYFSPRWYSMLGYEPYELAQTFDTWRELVHPDDLPVSEKVVFEHLESGTAFEIEFRMRTRDNQWKWILSRGKNAERDEKGKPLRMLGTHVDITDRKNAENEIIEQKQKAERYLNLAGVMFIGLDLDGKVNITNRHACRVLEYEEADLVGRNWFDDFVAEDSRNEARGVFNHLVSGLIEPMEYSESRIISKTGKVKTVAWHNTNITDDSGRVVSVLSAGEDITDKRTLEAQLQKVQKMESIGNLAGGIAHDFNNLLVPIIGMSEILLDHLPEESPDRKKVNAILEAGLRGSDLVKQILAFSRRSELKKSPIRIQNVLKEVIKLSRSTIPADIEISQDIQQDCGLVMADATQIHQIAMNLITNAYHAIKPPGGKIRIHFKEAVLSAENITGGSALSGRYAVLSISDNGCGIDPAIQDKIFEPYFTTKKKGKGTGLGLAVVYGIVKEHGGEIQMKTQVGEGTTIHVYFPVIHQSSETNAVPRQKELPSGTERILLIDDESTIARVEKLILESLGYTVTYLTSSLEALDLFRTDPEAFDMMITDMSMPNMTGDQLAKEIIAINPDTPIIICTGFSERLNKEQAQAIGIKGFLMKPVLRSDLAQMVRNVLDESKNAS